jgi:hypothetical protein
MGKLRRGLERSVESMVSIATSLKISMLMTIVVSCLQWIQLTSEDENDVSLLFNSVK